MRNCIRIATATLLALATGAAAAQTTTSETLHGSMPQSAPQHMQMPTQPGQEAFATIQEIVGILEADPHTDWSRVNIPALREHLIDMNEVTLYARTKSERIPGGLSIAVTGKGRTLAAIRRMVNMHAHVINGLNGWSVSTKPLADGVELTVTASDPRQVAMIRGLGFMGIMVQGAHHQMHHLAIARGQMAY